MTSGTRRLQMPLDVMSSVEAVTIVADLAQRAPARVYNNISSNRGTLTTSLHIIAKKAALTIANSATIVPDSQVL